MERRPVDHHHGVDGPAVDYTNDKQTGLLTRFVPTSLKHGAGYRMLLRATRVLQFLSAVISFGLFTRRLHNVRKLVNAYKTRRGVNSSYGAVEGILAAAVLYTLIGALLTLLRRNANVGKKNLRWLWVDRRASCRERVF